MEGSRDQELASIFATSRRELVEVVEETMALAGREHSAERAEELVAALDGVLLAALQRHAEAQPAYLPERLTHLMGQHPPAMPRASSHGRRFRPPPTPPT